MWLAILGLAERQFTREVRSRAAGASILYIRYRRYLAHLRQSRLFNSSKLLPLSGLSASCGRVGSSPARSGRRAVAKSCCRPNSRKSAVLTRPLYTDRNREGSMLLLHGPRLLEVLEAIPMDLRLGPLLLAQCRSSYLYSLALAHTHLSTELQQLCCRIAGSAPV